MPGGMKGRGIKHRLGPAGAPQRINKLRQPRLGPCARPSGRPSGRRPANTDA